MKELRKVAIIGCGMGGMVCASHIDNTGNKVVIYERHDEPGKKLLITGNGHCNITNENIEPKYYYSKSPGRLMALMKDFTYEKSVSMWKKLGLMLKSRDGYVYPVSDEASSVVNVLLARLEELGVEIRYNTPVNSIDISGTGFLVNGEYYDKVVIATGGMAGIYRENEINGYAMLRRLDVKCNYCYPALTKAVCENPNFKIISGVRCDVNIKLCNEGIIDEEEGQLQITDNGLSGIPVFQLSRYIGELIDKGAKPYFEVDFLKYTSGDELAAYVDKAYDSRNIESLKLANGLMHSKLALFMLAIAGINPYDRINNIDKHTMLNALLSMKNYRFNITKLANFKSAQISSGGVSLNEINDSFECVRYPGMYIIGEALDCAGKCGGYNLHFATQSGYKAAADIG